MTNTSINNLKCEVMPFSEAMLVLSAATKELTRLEREIGAKADLSVLEGVLCKSAGGLFPKHPSHGLVPKAVLLRGLWAQLQLCRQARAFFFVFG